MEVAPFAEMGGRWKGVRSNITGLAFAINDSSTSPPPPKVSQSVHTLRSMRLCEERSAMTTTRSPSQPSTLLLCGTMALMYTWYMVPGVSTRIVLITRHKVCKISQMIFLPRCSAQSFELRVVYGILLAGEPLPAPLYLAAEALHAECGSNIPQVYACTVICNSHDFLSWLK